MACGNSDSPDAEDDLTSLKVTERSFQVEGVYYVAGDSPEYVRGAADTIMTSLFSTLSRMGITTRQSMTTWSQRMTFTTTAVKVLSPSSPKDPALEKSYEVRYTLKDSAVVPNGLAQRNTLSLNIMSYADSYQDGHVEFEEACDADPSVGYGLQYTFDGNRASCTKFYAAQSRRIATDKLALRSVDAAAIPLSQFTDFFSRATVTLGPSKGASAVRYPEYDQLYRGGVVRGELNARILYSPTDHEPSTTGPDGNAVEWARALSELFRARPGLRYAGADAPLSEAALPVAGAGSKAFPGMMGMLAWLSGSARPAGLSDKQMLSLQLAVQTRLEKKELRFEERGKVKIGSGPETPTTLRITTSLDENSVERVKHALKSSDILFYNGHSSFGEGAWAPEKFSASDFPSTYQILGIDSCSSFNYYGDPYFGLHPGGRSKLDMLTNGIAADVTNGGVAMGRVLGRLLDGTGASYTDILKAGSILDANRIVDGEEDNRYTPATKVQWLP